MDLQRRLEFLVEFAGACGFEVRSESLGGEGGGLCKLRGKTILFVDLAADLETRYEKTLAALAGRPELDQRFVPPEIREDLASRART